MKVVKRFHKLKVAPVTVGPTHSFSPAPAAGSEGRDLFALPKGRDQAPASPRLRGAGKQASQSVRRTYCAVLPYSSAQSCEPVRVAYLTNSSGRSGVGHRAIRVKRQLDSMGVEVTDFHFDGTRALLSKNGRPADWVKKWPGLLGNKSINWVRLGRKLQSYIELTDGNDYRVYHATNQSLSWLGKRLQPMVVTVHDIIEVTDPQDKRAEILNKYLLSGIERAEHIICVSQYTADEVVRFFKVDEEKITVIRNGVGPEYHVI